MLGRYRVSLALTYTHTCRKTHIQRDKDIGGLLDTTGNGKKLKHNSDNREYTVIVINSLTVFIKLK